MSANSRYAVAVHCVLLLENPGGTWTTSEWIAGSVNTNAVIIRRALRTLAANGLVETAQGPKGGYRLVRPANQISLWDVYAATRDGEGLGLHASPPNPECPIGKHVQGQLLQVYAETEKAMRSVLSEITVADLRLRIRKA